MKEKKNGHPSGGFRDRNYFSIRRVNMCSTRIYIIMSRDKLSHTQQSRE